MNHLVQPIGPYPLTISRHSISTLMEMSVDQQKYRGSGEPPPYHHLVLLFSFFVFLKVRIAWHQWNFLADVTRSGCPNNEVNDKQPYKVHRAQGLWIGSCRKSSVINSHHKEHQETTMVVIMAMEMVNPASTFHLVLLLTGRPAVSSLQTARSQLWTLTIGKVAHGWYIYQWWVQPPLTNDNPIN